MMARLHAIKEQHIARGAGVSIKPGGVSRTESFVDFNSSLRSRREHKAWAASPRKDQKHSFIARGASESAIRKWRSLNDDSTVARFAGLGTISTAILGLTPQKL